MIKIKICRTSYEKILRYQIYWIYQFIFLDFQPVCIEIFENFFHFWKKYWISYFTIQNDQEKFSWVCFSQLNWQWELLNNFLIFLVVYFLVFFFLYAIEFQVQWKQSSFSSKRSGLLPFNLIKKFVLKFVECLAM